MPTEFLFSSAVRGGTMTRGIVKIGLETGEVLVDLKADVERTMRCAILVVSPSGSVPLSPGDEVLAWVGDDEEEGVIVGRIRSAQASVEGQSGLDGAGTAGSPTLAREDLTDTVLLEAKESLTLRVGEGSITIRADGKILIKGKDLVSHAKNVNRIKGGAVAIN